MQFCHPATFESYIDDESLLKAEELAVELLSESVGIFGWGPFNPSPPPLSQNRLAGRIIPRAPVRLTQPASKEGGGGLGAMPPKQDPRMTRFTEAVALVINGLIDNGDIARIGAQRYGFTWILNQIPGSTAQNGQIFYDTSTGLVSWKDENGVVFAFSGGGSGSGTVDGGSP